MKYIYSNSPFYGILMSILIEGESDEGEN